MFEDAVVYFSEGELAYIMYHLPNNTKIKAYLQKAGNNKFGW